MFVLQEIESKMFLTQPLENKSVSLTDEVICYTDFELATRHAESWNRFYQKEFMKVVELGI